MTPPQTLVLPEHGDWRVRVVPNLYPALERQEVVVHSPRHVRSIADLEDEEIELVAEAWRRRGIRAAQGVRAKRAPAFWVILVRDACASSPK